MALGLQRKDDDINSVIARVKRAMPRNTDVLAICEHLEGMLRNGSAKAEKPEPDLERIREQTRLRVARHRAKQRAKQRKGRK